MWSGLRWVMFYGDQTVERMTEGEFDWIWPLMEKEGIPKSRCWPGCSSESSARSPRPIHASPLIIDHCGLKVLAPRAPMPWSISTSCWRSRSCPTSRSRRPPRLTYSAQPYPFRSLQRPAAYRLFDAYGPDRFFWGTDMTRMTCTYRQCVTHFTEELPWLAGQDLEKVMGRGLAKWVGWDFKF